MVFRKIRKWRYSFFIFLSILGPGLLSALAGDDSGGIITYTILGVKFKYNFLWLLAFSTLSLAVSQELGARLGVVTGKGLADLIREHFRVKWTLFATFVLFLANISNTIANFAGIAAALEIFNISHYFVIIAAILLWYIVVNGDYKKVEKIFAIMTLAYISYIITGIIVKPDWSEVLKSTIIPHFEFNSLYFKSAIALMGTTVAPWMQFFVQSVVVDKGLTIKDYKYEKLDVYVGSFLTNLVAFFIIISAANSHNPNLNIITPKDAALVLKPLLGTIAPIIFAIGLLGASLLTSSIVPLTTSYAICGAFGWERSVNKSLFEAPIFFGLYTFSILISLIVVLLPNISLISIIFFSQVLNGILLPIILIFMYKLVNNKDLMKNMVNTPFQNIIILITISITILATFFIFI